MTPDEQIKAVAELDGWMWCEKNHQDNISEKFSIEKKVWYNPLKDHWLSEYELPPYLTSRDAIVPVIEKHWTSDVREIMLNRQSVLSTPAQLCEALLRAAGRWTD